MKQNDSGLLLEKESRRSQLQMFNISVGHRQAYSTDFSVDGFWNDCFGIFINASFITPLGKLCDSDACLPRLSISSWRDNMA